MSEWQDISTAPKDGTWVLVWGAFDREMPQVHFAAFNKGTGYWLDTYGLQEDPWVGNAIGATHWMPLPEGPAKPTTGE